MGLVRLTDTHEKLNETQRMEAVQFYGDEAMKMLREAVKRGFKDAAHMRQDKDLESLFNRTDFQMLLKELEKK